MRGRRGRAFISGSELEAPCCKCRLLGVVLPPPFGLSLCAWCNARRPTRCAAPLAQVLASARAGSRSEPTGEVPGGRGGVMLWIHSPATSRHAFVFFLLRVVDGDLFPIFPARGRRKGERRGRGAGAAGSAGSGGRRFTSVRGLGGRAQPAHTRARA